MDFEILIPISLFASFFGMVYMHYKTQNSERLALIEKGLDASIFDKKKQDKTNALKIGMLFIGVALGILIGSIIDEYTKLDEEAYFSMIFLFGGLALVLNDFIERKRAKEDGEEKKMVDVIKEKNQSADQNTNATFENKNE